MRGCAIPDEFFIVGMAHGDLGVELGLKPYPRELKKLNKGLRDGDLYFIDENGKPILPYRRILIQKNFKFCPQPINKNISKEEAQE